MDDLISGHRLMSVIKPMVGIFTADDEFYISYNAVLNAIEYAPKIEPKRGKWIPKTMPQTFSDERKDCVQCSNCKTHWDVATNYCPNCGARMDGGNGEQD